MRCKKKKEEPEFYHTPFDSTTKPPVYDLSPYAIMPDIGVPEVTEITSLNDNMRRFITTTYPGTSVTYIGSTTGEPQTIYYPSKHWRSFSTTLDYEDFMKKIGKEEEAKVKINLEHFKDKYVCYIKDSDVLSPENVLMTLSAIKGRLMMEISPIHVKEFQCSMTPAVRKNIIQASKKLAMYGKRMPIIARFDEFGRPLPDKIEINNSDGILLKILDPEDVGELYLELAALEFTTNEWDLDKIPF
jgi:hypothetical protein